MNLTDTQKKQVAQWIVDGAKLADIQKRIVSELGLTLTYMEVRLLVDDLKVMPKDPAPPVAAAKSVLDAGGAPTPGPAPASPEVSLADPLDAPDLNELASAATGNVSLTVDTLTRPGAMVSGSVKFSDGQTATWHLDQMGRLGLAAKQQGYRPSAGDLQAFQRALETELSKIGF